MNFDKFEEELQKHNDRLLHELNEGKHARPQAEARPFQRTHRPAAAETDSFTARQQDNKKQSSLFPGVHSSLGRLGFED